jgi:hypothetical protein
MIQVAAMVMLWRSRDPFDRRSAIEVVVIENLVFVFCGVLYYHRLCKLRDRGQIVDAQVIPGRGETIFWIKYSYAGKEYERRVGMVVDFDRSVRETLKRAVTEKAQVRVLLDPHKPTRYFILPFESKGPG